MKKLFIAIIITILSSCLSHTEINVKNVKNLDETMIAIYTKITKHGSIHFYRKINPSTIQFIVYQYSINVEQQKVYCVTIRNDSVDISKIPDTLTIRGLTSEDFNKRLKGKPVEKYYKCFSDNFLDMSNNEKIKLLDSLSQLYKFNKRNN
jgi:hypothetical protein